MSDACRQAKAGEDSSRFTFKYLYDSAASLKDKIEIISKQMYGADGVVYSELAEKRLASYAESGFSHLPICMAKTQYSLSCDAKLKGVPKVGLIRSKLYVYMRVLYIYMFVLTSFFIRCCLFVVFNYLLVNLYLIYIM